MGQLTHISATGEASMVDVSHKPASLREAVARGEIRLAPETLALVESDRIEITASAKITAPTGVEMEALTAVTVAALTIYDMCKAVDKGMVIGEVRLVSKTKTPVAR